MTTHGGKRAGAGRKSRAEKYERPINRAEKQIVDQLPRLVDNMLQLANGGYEVVEEKYLPAGLVTTGSGEFETMVFPDKPADELVLVERKRSIADRDRAANQYLIDRIMGKPTQRQEITGEDGGPIEITADDTELLRRYNAVAQRLRARGDHPSASECESEELRG